MGRYRIVLVFKDASSRRWQGVTLVDAFSSTRTKVRPYSAKAKGD